MASFEIRLPFSHDAEAYYVTLKRLVHILAPVKFHLAFPVQQRNMFILSEDYLARARVVVVEGVSGAHKSAYESLHIDAPNRRRLSTLTL